MHTDTPQAVHEAATGPIEDGPQGRHEGATSWVESGTWLPIRDAAREARVSISAVKKWYGRRWIPSRMEPGPTGARRLVRLEDVVQRRDNPGWISPEAGYEDDTENPQEVLEETSGRPQERLVGGPQEDPVTSEDGSREPRGDYEIGSDLAKLAQSLPEILADNATIRRELVEVTDRAARAETKLEFLSGIRGDRDALEQKVVEVEHERDELRREIGEARAERDRLAEHIDVYRQRLDENRTAEPQPARSSWWARVWRGE
jgi:hypothetical protein